LHPGHFDRGAAGRSALKAGLLGIFVGTIPLIGMVLTGWLAVYFYRREKGAVPATSVGARLGGAAGVVVSAINALFAITVILFHAEQACIDGIVEIAHKVGIDTTSPQFQNGVDQLFKPSGLISSFVVFLMLAAAGGALATLLLRQPRV